MATASQHESNIVSRLAATDPQLSTALGTPVRKLIEAVANELSSLSSDINATSTLYSLNAVSGQDLDYLVGQFGFTRQEARAARGMIRFTRDNGDAVLQVPYGAQFYKPPTSTSPAVSFQTTSYQELAQGVLVAEVPVVCTTLGSIGNVAANTVTRSTGFSSYISCSNDEAMTGGRDAESDEQLRTRFLETVFRNESSTRDQYIALASANKTVSRVNLVGQSARYSEVVQASKPSSSVIASVTDEKFNVDVRRVIDTSSRYWVTLTESERILGSGEYTVSVDGKTVTFQDQFTTETVGPTSPQVVLRLAHTNISNVTVTLVSDPSVSLVAGIDYTLDAVNGTITVKADSAYIQTGDALAVSYYYSPVNVGEFVTIEFDYASLHNRDTLKSVDVWVDGTEPTLVTDVQYIDTTNLITSANTDTWEKADGNNPTVDNIYIPLAYRPLMSGDTMIRAISMGVSQMLVSGVYFNPIWDVSDVRGTQGSLRSIDAIELIGSVTDGGTTFTFSGSAPDYPSIKVNNNTPIAIPYYYDASIERIQTLLDQQSVVTSDTLVHEAKTRRFNVYLTLMFSAWPKDVVIQRVQDAVSDWMGKLPFGTTIQISDIETVAANVPGVDNVRLATANDAANNKIGSTNVGAYGVVEFQRDNTTIVPFGASQYNHTTDIVMAQNEVALPLEVICYSLAQKGW